MTTTRKVTVIREDGERRSLEIVAKANGTVWLWDSAADPNSDSLVQLQDDSDTSVADVLGPDWEICEITVYWDDTEDGKMDVRHMTCGELAAICDYSTAGDFSVNDDFPSCETTPCMVVVDGDGMIRQWALGDDPARVDEWQDIGDPVPWQRRYRTITVYWDDAYGVWAYRTTDADGRVSRGTVGVAPEASIADAIDQACYQLDVELTHDDFAIDGLCADWAAEVPA